MKKRGDKRARRERHKDGDGFRPAARCIYRYHDGRRWVRADPIRIQRELLTDPDLSLETDLKLAMAETPETAAAVGRVVNAVRRAFRVTSFADGGLLDTECIELLGHFAAFLQELKKKVGFWPTSATPTAPASSAGDSLTPSGPASCSTGSGSPAGAALPSPSA
jgi:hypothetical protein